MEKEILKTFIVVILCVFGLGLLLALAFNIANTKPKYFYKDVYGNYGTSSECGEVKSGTLSCLVNDNFIPVEDFSKIKKGVDLDDFWK